MAFVYDGAGSLASIRISLDILLLVEIALLAIEDNCTGALFSSISGANETCELAKSRHTIGANNENFQYPVAFASLSCTVMPLRGSCGISGLYAPIEYPDPLATMAPILP